MLKYILKPNILITEIFIKFSPLLLNIYCYYLPRYFHKFYFHSLYLSLLVINNTLFLNRQFFIDRGWSFFRENGRRWHAENPLYKRVIIERGQAMRTRADNPGSRSIISRSDTRQ